MHKSLFLVYILLFLISSCELLKKESHNPADLIQKVQQVIAGHDSTSNLSLLRDKELPPAINPNLIKADTFTAAGKKYYTVLAEYPDPFYNRFAILDTDYNVLLMDKSLNGYLTESRLNSGNFNFIEVKENFLSKGILRLKRLSLYSVNEKEEVGLVFRTYIELTEPGISYKQEITNIGPGEIDTRIYSTSPDKSKLIQDKAVYLYNKETKSFDDGINYFDSFVVSEVNGFQSESFMPEIISRSSYLKQSGIKLPEKTTEHKLGNFSMPLSDEWNEVKNVKISELLKKPMEGTRFINNHYGAEISVIRIPENDSAESFIKYPFENVSSGNYIVRFTDKITGGKYFYQFFEYSCGSEKFLLILQTLKTTYDLYKNDYQNLVNSFSMDC